MAGKKRKRTPRGAAGIAITQAHKKAKIHRQATRGNARRDSKPKVVGSWAKSAVQPRPIIPQTIEQWRKHQKKVKPENEWLTHRDTKTGALNHNKYLGKFPITELMEKPIQYRRAS